MPTFGRKRRMCEWADLAADDTGMTDVLTQGHSHHLSLFFSCPYRA
jgi:hypothetical protein